MNAAERRPGGDAALPVHARLTIAFAGLLGALATAGAAAAAHGFGGERLGLAAALAFVHAPALLALGLAGPKALRWSWLPAALLAVGVTLFSGDLAARELLGDRAFPNAAPTGGTVLILGWLSLALLAFLPRRRRPPEA